MPDSRLYYALRKDILLKPPFTFGNANDVNPSQIDAEWLAPALSPSGTAEEVVPVIASQIDAAWGFPPLVPNDPLTSNLPAAVSQIDVGWLSRSLIPNEPQSVTITAFQGRIDANWAAVDLSPAPPTTALVDQTQNRIDSQWQTATMLAESATEAVLTAEASQLDAKWDSPDLVPFAPTEDTVDQTQNQIDAQWQSVLIEVNPPVGSIFTAVTNRIDALWNDVSALIDGPLVSLRLADPSVIEAEWSGAPILTTPGSGAVCLFGGSHLEATTFPGRAVDAFAISGWFQVSEITNNTLVAKWDFSGALEWLVFFTVSGIDFGISTNGSLEFVTHAGLVGGFIVDTWYFFYVQRTATEMQIWVGTLDDVPVQGPSKTISGVTDITSTQALFGAQRNAGAIVSTLSGRLDTFSFWKNIPTITPEEIWGIENYVFLTTPQKSGLGGWWDFSEEEGTFPPVWVDSHAGGFDLDSKPIDGAQRCDGREIDVPTSDIFSQFPSRIDTIWASADLIPDSTTEAFLGSGQGQVDAEFAIGVLLPDGPTEVSIAAIPSRVDAAWASTPIGVGSITEEILFQVASRIDAVWQDAGLVPSEPITFAMAAMPSMIDAGWNAINLDPDENGSSVRSADSSRIEAGWGNVEISASPPTLFKMSSTTSRIEALFVDTALKPSSPGVDVLPDKPSQVDAGWEQAALSSSPPTNSTLSAAATRVDAAWGQAGLIASPPLEFKFSAVPGQVDAAWSTVDMSASPPAEEVLNSKPSRIEAIWLSGPLLPLSFGGEAACFEANNTSFMNRDIVAKAGPVGFETAATQGYLSVWFRNEVFLDIPNASFLFSATSGSGARLQFGFIKEALGGGLFGFFESDTLAGAGIGSMNGETADIGLGLINGWNHVVFGYTAGNIDWDFWLNGQKHTVSNTFTSPTQDARWFSDIQTAALVENLTLTAQQESGGIADSFAICLDEMILRRTPPTQAIVDFLYNSGSGRKITEIDFSQVPGDYAWRFTEENASVGDEFFGISPPGDKTDFFTVNGATPETPGIPGSGTFDPFP